MEMFLSDMIDRLTILYLKVDHGEYALIPQLEDYIKGVAERVAIYGTEKKIQILNLRNELFAANRDIWNLESDIRKGKEGELGLKEVGERAIKIREFNKKRVDLKNQIEALIAVWDVKINHGSE
jgi:hypothetical protein